MRTQSTPAVEVEQKLWTSFTDYNSDLDFIDAWLALQCQMIVGARHGWLFAEGDDGSFNLIAHYAKQADRDIPAPLAEVLSQVVGEITETGEGVAEPVAVGTADARAVNWIVALPLSADRGVAAASVVGITANDTAGVASAMRQLQWGGGWVLDWLRRQKSSLPAARPVHALAPAEGPVPAEAMGGQALSGDVLRLIANVIEAPRYRDAAAVLATRLSETFELERASVGVHSRGRTRIVAMSHAAFARDRMDEVRRVEAAMDEALDQSAAIILPADAQAPGLVVRASRALAEAANIDGVASLPLTGPRETRGALTAERQTPFSDAERSALEAVARLTGVALLEKHLNDRSILAKIGHEFRGMLAALVGPRWPLTKVVAGLITVFLAAIAFIPTTLEIRAPVELEAAELRVVAAPFDGYLSKALVRAGDRVKLGQPMARFDIADLLLQRTGLQADRNQEAVKFEEATATFKQAEAKVHRAQMAKIDAELSLVDAKLARADIKAPFEGLVVSGDLSQSIGEPMKTGRELFEIAPADAFRLVLKVDERDISHVAAKQKGSFVLAARPEDSREFIIKRVTPILKAADGRNYYRVEAQIAGTSEAFRPGLEGRGRIDTDQTSILWVWTRDIVNWTRLKLWAYVP